MKAGGPIHVHGAGVQLLTVGTWAGCPADSGYIRIGGPADFHVNTYMYSMATVPYYML